MRYCQALKMGLGFAVLLVLQSACVFADTPVAAAELGHVDKVVQIKSNQVTFQVTLQSNPTTGFNWYLLHCNEKLLAPIKAKFTPPENKKMMGAPGKVTWTFRAEPLAFKVPRVMFVDLVYARPWSLQGSKPYRIAVVSAG